jgi:parafibromin
LYSELDESGRVSFAITSSVIELYLPVDTRIKSRDISGLLLSSSSQQLFRSPAALFNTTTFYTPLGFRGCSKHSRNRFWSVSRPSIMASVDPSLHDPLLALRRAIAAGSLPTPTTSSDLSDRNATEDLAKATHLYFRQPIPQTIPLTAPTRFVSASSDSAVDLRSIFFAWQKKDVAIPEYIASAQELNESLKQKERKEGEPEEKVQNLVFVERLDLITWLEGASDESEYIKPLEGAAAAAPSAAPADASAAIAPGAAGAVSAVPGGAQAAVAAQGGRALKAIDPRLQEIYNGERKMGDRNSVLRGIKPTVSSAPPAA